MAAPIDVGTVPAPGGAMVGRQALRALEPVQRE
jgi:hypothetical protein